MESIGNIFSKSYSPLPTTSRSQQSHTNTPTHLIPYQLLKSKQVISITIIFFALISLLTYSSQPFLASRGYTHIGFPSKGLKSSLWQELDAIPWRSVILEPTELPFVEETSQELPVPWSTKPFLPSGTLFDTNGQRLPIPSHQIKVLPRVVVLNATEEARTQVERMMFGVCTTVARAKEISVLWTRWLTPFDPTYGFDNSTRDLDSLPRPACLVLISDSEELKDIIELRGILKKRDIRCEVRVSTEPRYEIRVLSMVKELRDYAERLE